MIIMEVNVIYLINIELMSRNSCRSSNLLAYYNKAITNHRE